MRSTQSICFSRLGIFFFVCAGFSLAALAVGSGLIGFWFGLIGTGVIAAAWITAKKNTSNWLAHMCLVASTGLACTTVLFGSPGWLMIMAGGFSLAAWDLLFLIMAIAMKPDTVQNRQYVDTHLKSLAAAIGLGIIIAIIGRWIRLGTPFIVLALIVALFIFGMDRLIRILDKK